MTASDQPVEYVDYEVGLTTGAVLYATLELGRDLAEDDPLTPTIRLLTRHSADHLEELLITRQTIAYVKRIQRTVQPETRLEDGHTKLIGATQHG